MMTVQLWTYLFVALSFGLYIGIAIWSRAGSTNDFYVCLLYTSDAADE